MAQSHPHRNSRKKTWIACGLAVGLGAFAMFNDLPRPSSASGGSPLDEFVLYGIGSQSGDLLRYQFSDGALTTVGTIKNGTTTLTDIQASAYVPRNSNIFTFWNDPADGQTKLVYVNTNTAKASIVGTPMGTGTVTSAVAAMPNASASTLANNQKTPTSDITQYGLYAVKGPDAIPFEIVNEEVVPAKEFAAKVTVLGAALSHGGKYNCAVTGKIQIGADTVEPWGVYSQAANGNINENANDETGNSGTNPRSYVMPNTYPLGTPITITGRSWKKTHVNADGTQNSNWNTNMVVDSSTNTPQLITLRDGDPVPDIDGYRNQLSVAEFIADYIDSDTNTVVLGPAQAIYLYELGVTNLNSAGADFNDLVMLVTLAKDPSELSTTTNITPTAHLINVDPRNAMYTEVMPLSRAYDGLAATSAQTFYGTHNGQLYAIDPANATETLVGTLPYSQNVEAFETAGNTFYGFTNVANQLRAVDTATGQIIGADINTGITDLGSITLVRLADEPLRHAYD